MCTSGPRDSRGKTTSSTGSTIDRKEGGERKSECVSVLRSPLPLSPFPRHFADHRRRRTAVATLSPDATFYWMPRQNLLLSFSHGGKTRREREVKEPLVERCYSVRTGKKLF